MNSSNLSVILVGLLLTWLDLTGCRNIPDAQGQPEVVTAKMDTLLIARPDAQDLLVLLRGRWRNDADSAYQIQITDSLLQYYYGHNLLRQGQLEVDAACTAVSCASDSLTLNGWCVLEKDSAETHCLVILKCDQKVLQLRALGAANPQLNFQKL